MGNIQHYIDLAVEMAMNYGPKLLPAILTYVILYEEVKKEFDTSGISISFPQRDVHIIEKS